MRQITPQNIRTHDIQAWCEVVRPMPSIGAKPGDRVITRAGYATPLVLVRVLPPDFFGIADALIRGDIRPVCREMSTTELLNAFDHIWRPAEESWEQAITRGPLALIRSRPTQ